MNIKVNIFQNAADADCSYSVPILSVLKAIKTGKWKEQVELVRYVEDRLKSEVKKALPAVTFSGTFNRKRHDHNIEKYTGIIVLDIDKIDSKVIKKLKEDLIKDEYCFCFFDSPSFGLKCLFNIDAPATAHKEYSFKQVKDYFEMKYMVPVDKSGSNLSRLCFVSYDPELYFDEKKIVFHVDVDVAEDQFAPIIKYKRKNTGIQDAGYSFRVCKSWVEKSGCHYVKGQRNVYLYKLCCNLNRVGFTLEDMVYYIHKEHSISKEMYAELMTCARSAAKNKNEFNTKPIWIKSDQNVLFGTDSSQQE